MKNEVCVKFKAVGCNSNDAKMIVQKELNKDTMPLEYEFIDGAYSNNYTLHEIIVKFIVSAKTKTQAKKIVNDEMSKDTMCLRFWELI